MALIFENLSLINKEFHYAVKNNDVDKVKCILKNRIELSFDQLDLLYEKVIKDNNTEMIKVLNSRGGDLLYALKISFSYKFRQCTEFILKCTDITPQDASDAYWRFITNHFKDHYAITRMDKYFEDNGLMLYKVKAFKRAGLDYKGSYEWQVY